MVRYGSAPFSARLTQPPVTRDVDPKALREIQPPSLRKAHSNPRVIFENSSTRPDTIFTTGRKLVFP